MNLGIVHRKLICTSWQWSAGRPGQLPHQWCSADWQLEFLRSRLCCFVFTPLTIQCISLQECFSHGPSGCCFYLNSFLSVTLNISIFLTAYPANRSSFLLYSSHLSAPLRSFTSFSHPEKSVPQAQQAFLFAEVSETVHMCTLMRSLRQIAQFLVQPS